VTDLSNTAATLTVDGQEYRIHRLDAAADAHTL
jgi:hypothetical protein